MGKSMDTMEGSRENVSSRRVGRLEVYAGDLQGEIISMEDGETFLIGRDISKCAIICNSAKVSRVHVSITCRQRADGHTEYLVRDLSTNGTISSMTGFLPKNQDVLIRPGTEIGLGRSDETIKFLE